MARCGCTLQGYACEVGRQLAVDVFCGSLVVENPLFEQRPVQERKRLYRLYEEAVEAYRRHCQDGDEAMVEGLEVTR